MAKIQLLSSILTVVLLILFVVQPAAHACSFMQVVAQDGTRVTSRSMEFGVDLKPSWTVIPRGREFVSPAPEGRRGVSWKTRYGTVAAFNFGDNTMAIDGMNEKGLVVSGLWYENDMKWPDLAASGDAPVLSNALLITWLLGNFQTTAEVTKALKSVAISAQKIPQMGGMAPPLHFAAQDATGGSIVIEWDNGKLNIYDNPLGIMTNAPNFPYMMTHLRNYVGLNDGQWTGTRYNGVNLAPTGHGAGMFGLPGDITPPSRFVRLAVLRQFADPAPDAAAAVKLARHLMNSVYITRGTIVDRNAAGEVTASESTQWTAYYDLTNRVLYFQTYDNSTLRKIDLKAIDFDKVSHQSINLFDENETIIDATTRIK